MNNKIISFLKWFKLGAISWITLSNGSRPRRVLKSILLKLKYQINRHPKLKEKLSLFLDNFPTIKHKLKNIRHPYIQQDEFVKEEQNFQKPVTQSSDFKKQKLAMVTPIPPDKTGIADYIAELLPSLSNYYDIEIITEKETLDFYNSFTVRNIEFFKLNAHLYDCIVYQMGNSPFHSHMFELIDKHGGVVVLHDFHIGNVVAWMQDNMPKTAQIWDQMLLDDYGYSALYQRYKNGNYWAAYNFPMNMKVMKNAKGVIVHSAYAKTLSSKWYGNFFDNKLFYLPQVHRVVDCEYFKKDQFLVCSFGHITKTKMVDRILKAWLLSSLSVNPNNRLVFVGSTADDSYSMNIKEQVAKLPNVEITEYIEEAQYQAYLSHADIAIQLRSNSMGETSRAVLDCLAYGIPTIISTNGSMSEFADESVYKLLDEFSDYDLAAAMEKLYKEEALRDKISLASKTLISQQHAPDIVASLMHEIIEEIYEDSELLKIKTLCETHGQYIPEFINKKLASSFKDMASDANKKLPTIYIDISALRVVDLKTGIQRVVRSMLLALLEQQFSGCLLYTSEAETVGLALAPLSMR